jgi:hypothetical protein
MNGALYDGDSLSNLLTLQCKLPQLILGLLHDQLQVLVTCCLGVACGVTRHGGRAHDIRNGHTITSIATLETKGASFLDETPCLCHPCRYVACAALRQGVSSFILLLG